MALNQSALLERLKECELTEATERSSPLTQRALQELINAEAELIIGAAPYERTSVTAPDPGPSRRLSVILTCASRSFERGRSSRPCWMVAAIIRTVFVPRSKRELVHAQFEEVVATLARSHPSAAEL